MLSVARDDRKKTTSGKDPKRKRVLWHPFVALNSCKVIKFIENLCLTSKLPRIIYFFDRERAVSWESCILIGSGSGQYFPYVLTTVMVTNYAKRRVKLRLLKTLKWLILHFAKFVDFWKRNFTQCKNIPDQFILLYICWHVDETMCKIKTRLFQVFLIVSPTF